MQEITFVVSGTSHLLSFINVPNLERILYSEQYTRVHPAFVWAALALANLMRSSNRCVLYPRCSGVVLGEQELTK